MMRRSERRNTTQMRKCAVMRPHDKIKVKSFIRNVEVMTNKQLKLVQLGNSQ